MIGVVFYSFQFYLFTVVNMHDVIILSCIACNMTARDIQAWETIPLGPFLGKSFSKTLDTLMKLYVF